MRRLIASRVQASEAEKHLKIVENLSSEERRALEHISTISVPQTWVAIDEAQNILPSERKTSATDIIGGLSVPADVVSNGIPPQFHPGAGDRSPRHRGRFVVVAVSRLAREKRIDVLVEAVRRSRHGARLQLVVCGAGPEAALLRRAGATLPNPAEFRLVEPDVVPALMRVAAFQQILWSGKSFKAD